LPKLAVTARARLYESARGCRLLQAAPGNYAGLRAGQKPFFAPRNAAGAGWPLTANGAGEARVSLSIIIIRAGGAWAMGGQALGGHKTSTLETAGRPFHIANAYPSARAVAAPGLGAMALQ
jgi:hypothetical protein